MPLLKLKAALTKFLGQSQVRILGSKSFSIPITSGAMAASVFQDICGYVPGELTPQVEVFQRHESARAAAMQAVLEGAADELEAPWKEVLDPAQAVAVSAMVTPDLLGLCLFDEQGIGKTVMTIAAFDVLRQRGQCDRLVIVSPVTMKAGWKEEIERFIPKKYEIALLEGSPASKRDIVLGSFDVLICNFESLDSLLVPLKAALGSKKTLLAVDESFNVKNDAAVRSVAVRELRRHCVRGFVMCGTPAPNSPVDVIHQFDIADDGYTFAGFVSPKDAEEQVEAISDRIEQRGAFVRRLKDEVLPFLPPKNFNVISVEMTGRQAALYGEAKDRLELTLKSMDNATFKRSLATYFQQRAILLQICACPETVDPSFSDTSAKISALNELVERVVAKEGKKLVIWSFYVASLRDIFKRYSSYSPVLLDGSSTATQRAQAVKRFQTDPDVRLCIANPAAAGAGVTLHAASDAAYISFSNQAAHFLQSIDRIHRRGQKAESTDYHIFVCRDTIEETEVQRLRTKEVRQQELLGDQTKWPNSLDEALAELQRHHA